MKNRLIYPVGTSAACRYAAEQLVKDGYSVTDHPAPEVTHLLLDVPAKNVPSQALLDMLPHSVTVIGGNLPEAAEYRRIDLLKDDTYLAQNAAITAECAVCSAGMASGYTLRGSRTLVIGMGRIGFHLVRLLIQMGSEVTALTSDGKKRALLNSLGIPCITPETLRTQIQSYRFIINTAPVLTVSPELAALCTDCSLIDLASVPGIEGKKVIRALGLPGKLAWKQSGELIAKTAERLMEEEA